MGILDMLFGGGSGGGLGQLFGNMGGNADPWAGKRQLTQGGDGGGFGGLDTKGLEKFLNMQKKLQPPPMEGGGSQPQPSYPQQAPSTQAMGLPALILQYLQQQRR